MAETIKGGRYQLANKQWVDANGKPVAAPAKEAAEAAAKQAEPEAQKAAEKKGK